MSYRTDNIYSVKFGLPEARKVKVKVTLVEGLRFCIGRTAHRGSRGIALPFLDHSTRKGWGVSVKPRQLFTPGKDTVPIVQEAGWALGPVWTGAENLAPTGIRSPDSPARRQSEARRGHLNARGTGAAESPPPLSHLSLLLTIWPWTINGPWWALSGSESTRSRFIWKVAQKRSCVQDPVSHDHMAGNVTVGGHSEHLLIYLF